MSRAGWFQSIFLVCYKKGSAFNMKTIPNFKTEQEEREFWETHDSTEYMDWSKSKLVVFTKLQKKGLLFRNTKV